MAIGEAVLEPVDFSDWVQPYGVLWVFSEFDWVVRQVTANTREHLGIEPQDLLEQSLAVLLDVATFDSLQQKLALLADDPYSRESWFIQINQQWFSSRLYRIETGLILELEPAQPSSLTGLWSGHGRVKQVMAQLRKVPDLTEFLQMAAAKIRHMTGFDRVVIFQFDPQGNGAVVAEAKQADLSAYLGLHYPAADIPNPVRDLYQQGYVRYIPELEAPSIALIPRQHPLSQQPTDLRFSGLRGVDPCCVTYHQTMAVAALFVIPLIQDDKLWGLISCHHQTPKFIAYEVRESCEILGQLIASELTNKVNTRALDYRIKLRSLQSEFLQSISQSDDLKQALIHPAPRLLDLVNAQGAAVCLEDEITLVGTTPSPEQVRTLLAWAETQCLAHPAGPDPDTLFFTNALPKQYAAAAAFKDSASGLLMLQISKVQHYSLLWFRPEVLQTIDWAGNPAPTFTVDAEGMERPCPRRSFEQWREIVKFTALPWQACELENALDLKSAIVGIVLKKADELARINQSLERRNQELDFFAYAASHDLKEPLRGIHNYSNLLLKGYGELLDEVGQSRLQTLVRLTRRMESLINALLKFSRLSQTELQLQPTDTHALLHQALKDLSVSYPNLPNQIRILQPMPTVLCDPILLQEVFVNLISNAIKYNDKPDPWAEIGFDSSNTFYVRDNGIGIRERHFSTIFKLFKRLHEQQLYGGGTGAGLTIAQKIIDRHGGHLWVESTLGVGSTFYFTLPEKLPAL